MMSKRSPDRPLTQRLRLIEITNATFAKIQGKHMNMVQKYNRSGEELICVSFPKDTDSGNIFRELARPTQRIGNDTFLVPATLRDYLQLRQYQSSTNAKGVKITYVEARPSRVNPYALGCIKIRMLPRSTDVLSSWAEIICSKLNAHWWMYYLNQTKNAECKLKLENNLKKTVSPDAVLFSHDQKFPFFVLEVAITRTREELLKQAQLYLRGTRGHLKILAMLELRRSPTNKYHVLVTVWRLKRNPDPSLETPNHMIVEVVFESVEVYPRRKEGDLRITKRDVRPMDKIDEAANDHVDISLNQLSILAQAAVSLQEIDDLKAAAERSGGWLEESDEPVFIHEGDVRYLEDDDSDGEDPSWNRYKEISSII